MHYFLLRLNMLWDLLFADDGALMAMLANFRMAIPLTLFFFVLTGLPIKWAKTKGGHAMQWVGYWLDFAYFNLDVSVKRRLWVMNWIKDLLDVKAVVVGGFREGPGRLGFVCGPLIYLRPFLGPRYTWASVAPQASFIELPLYFIMVLSRTL